MIEPNYPPEFSPDKFLVLVVDDTSRNLQLVIEILDEQGYATTFASNGKQAIERVKVAKPDLMLLDLMMPEMNGLEVCKLVKSDNNYRDIPIIFLTASNEQNDLVKAFKEGAVDYIVKPFKKYELLARVETHLSLKYTRDQLQTALKKIEKLVSTDDLLGISNRRHIMQIADQEFARARRYQRCLSILMIDVDYFKRVNDTYGHPTGDQVLITLVDRIKQCLRALDSFGRSGGEEFLVFLPETPLDMALVVAERIRQIVEAHPVEIEEITLAMTISVGVTSLNAEDNSIALPLKRVDDALLSAKRQGRNQVVAG